MPRRNMRSFFAFCLMSLFLTNTLCEESALASAPKLAVAPPPNNLPAGTSGEVSINPIGGRQPQSVTSEEFSSEDIRFRVANFDFGHVSAPFIITAWIFVACIAKIGFNLDPRVANYCPESCMLLLVGIVLGLVLYYSGMFVAPLTNDVFFLFMLPPIVFDAGYFMPNRLFFDNIISILAYAVIGTVWNALSIGFSLWAIGLTGIFGYQMTILEMLLFSSIVSAVDPVAVLAVFEEIHVNEVLYIIVFGESLLNDAVTVVLYHMFETYTEMGVENILTVDYVSGISSFFVVSLGGTLIGIICGLMAAYLSKHTSFASVLEPMFPFLMGYLSYLIAEMFHLSSILALVMCGITMKNYVQENISAKSLVTVKYVTKMLATASETIIFVVLGVSTVNDNHEWNTYFVFLTILFCTVYRAIGVIVLTAVLNRFRLHQLNGVEQFIMSYGGLRGAVAFALALVIDESIIPSKKMMVTTVIAVVYFTVFLQGMTIKFFVRILRVPQKVEKEVSMNERLHSRVIDHLMGGIEEVADQILGNYKIRDRFKQFNNKYLRPILTRTTINEPKIIETHSRLNLEDAMNLVNNTGSRLTIDSNDTLSTVLRNYTQTNLAKLDTSEEIGFMNEVNGGRGVDGMSSQFLNVDMRELTHSPSNKDLADTEIHHILEDSMFKPQKRTRRYSHSQIYESEPRHPPFHHQVRMQIRRMVSESKRRRRKSRDRPPNGLISNKVQPRDYVAPGPNHPEVTVSPAMEKEVDEDGIVFAAKHVSDGVFGRTMTETLLPWKRDDDSSNGSPAKPQEEFPTYVDNREYYTPGYSSPTPSFLDNLSHRTSITGSVIIHEAIDEEEDDADVFETSYDNPAFSGVVSVKNEPHEEEDVEPDLKSDQKTQLRRRSEPARHMHKRDLENQFRKSDPAHLQRRSDSAHQRKDEGAVASPFRGDDVQPSLIAEVMGNVSHHNDPNVPIEHRFRHFHGPRSPDRFSMTSLRSGANVSRPDSGDTISIECPDVVVDVDNGSTEGKVNVTKL